VILTFAQVTFFVKKQQPWIRIFTSTLDALITALINDAMQFSLEVGNILEQLIFFAVVVSVVKANKPPRVDTLELITDESFDISL